MPKRMAVTDVDQFELDGDCPSSDAAALTDSVTVDYEKQPLASAEQTPVGTAGHVVDGMFTAIRRASITVNPFRRSVSVDARAVQH